MNISLDDPRRERRVALRALSIALAAIAVALGTAWITVGRAGRFQEMKGVFYTIDLPPSFERIDQEGSGASLTSLSESPELERTFASVLDPARACTILVNSFRRAEANVFPARQLGADSECSFSGRSQGFSVRADLRTLGGFLDHVERNELDYPAIPEGKRAVLSVSVLTD